jgi:transposase
VSDFGSLEALVERLLGRDRELESVVVQQERVIAEQADWMAQQADRIVELERRLGRDSSTSSRPSSSDAPWDKQPCEEALVTVPVGPQAGQAAGFGVGVAGLG